MGIISVSYIKLNSLLAQMYLPVDLMNLVKLGGHQYGQVVWLALIFSY